MLPRALIFHKIFQNIYMAILRCITIAGLSVTLLQLLSLCHCNFAMQHYKWRCRGPLSASVSGMLLCSVYAAAKWMRDATHLNYIWDLSDIFWCDISLLVVIHHARVIKRRLTIIVVAVVSAGMSACQQLSSVWRPWNCQQKQTLFLWERHGTLMSKLSP
jgi:hypothetical protein